MRERWATMAFMNFSGRLRCRGNKVAHDHS
jgi:hypothetical protein